MEFSNSRVLLLIQGSLCALWKVRFNFQALVSSFIKEIIDPSDLRLVPLKSFLGQLSKQSIRFMGSWDQFQRNAVWPSLKLVNFNFRNEEVLSGKFFQIGEVQLQRGSRVVDMVGNYLDSCFSLVSRVETCYPSQYWVSFPRRFAFRDQFPKEEFDCALYCRGEFKFRVSSMRQK